MTIEWRGNRHFQGNGALNSRPGESGRLRALAPTVLLNRPPQT